MVVFDGLVAVESGKKPAAEIKVQAVRLYQPVVCPHVKEDMGSNTISMRCHCGILGLSLAYQLTQST